MNTNKPTSSKPQKSSSLSLFLYLLLALSVPLMLPVSGMLLQTLVWQFVVSNYAGVAYHFSFPEGMLFSAVVGASVFLLSTLLYAVQNGFKIPETGNIEALNKLAAEIDSKPPAQLILHDLKCAGWHFIFFAMVIAALSSRFPGKLWFDGLAPVLIASLTFTTARIAYYAVLTMVLERVNAYMKVRNEKLALEMAGKH